MTSRITPVLAILIAIAVTLVYTRPTWTGPIADLNDRIDRYDAALTAAERFAQKEAELTRARAAIAPESLARLEAFLPDGVDNVQLILDLDALAARSGVTLANFDIKGQGEGDGTGTSGTPAPTTGAGTAGALPGSPLTAGRAQGIGSTSSVDSVELTMTATGSYSAFRRFLTGIEQSLRPMDIVSLSVDQSDTGVYSYDLTVRIYWLR